MTTQGLEHMPSDGQRPQPLPQPPDQRHLAPHASWVRPGEVLTIQGIRIASGMFYAGSSLHSHGTSNGVYYTVNGRLVATRQGPEPTVIWPPSYAAMMPASRHRFLTWMAGGRTDPGCGIAPVLLFFFGLEHRLFVDQGDDANEIVEEIERLLRIYGAERRFAVLARRCLAYARIAHGIEDPVPLLSPTTANIEEIRPAVRIALGKRLHEHGSLDADGMLLWTLSQQGVVLRKSATACFPEFVELFRLRFDEVHPTGIAVRAPVKRLVLKYTAASRSFVHTLQGPHRTYPDVTAATELSVAEFRMMVHYQSDELRKFAEFVAKKPGLRRSAAAVSLLPDDMQVARGLGPAHDIPERLRAIAGSGLSASLPMSELAEAVGEDVGAKLTDAAFERIEKALARAGFGIEPSKASNGAAPRLDASVVLFALGSEERPDVREDGFREMVRTADVVAYLTGLSGMDAAKTKTGLVVQACTVLPGVARMRFAAYAEAMFLSPGTEKQVLRRLSMLPRQAYGRLAAAAAAAVSAGGADQAGVKFLEKLHKALNMPQEDVYSAIHRASDDGLVSLTVERRVPGVPIPEDGVAGVRIDRERLSRIRMETDAVSGLLSGIFAEDAPLADIPEVPVGGGERFGGLDDAHAGLLAELEASGPMARSEFDGRARARKLLPDGAIETINEWSFDRFGEPLLEDGAEVAVDEAMRGRLAATGEQT